MDSKQIDISAIIVTWNAKELTRSCLASLLRSPQPFTMEVIVVDNASQDGVADMIAAGFPSVTLIRNPENAGFARANNQGIAIACGRYVCLINSDVEVPANCLSEMLSYMAANPSIGLLGPKMLCPDGSIGDSAMRWPSVSNAFWRALSFDTIPGISKFIPGALMRDFRYDRIADVEVLTGWFWMVRREALEKVGGLDEQFFMYGEDIDWCKRFWNAGWRVVFFPKAEALHYGGASSSRAPIRNAVEMLRARLQYVRKHHGMWGRIMFRIFLWIHHLIRVLGYGAVWLLRRSSQAAFKVKQSLACLMYLAGSRSNRLAER